MCYLLLFSLEKMIELFLRKTHSDLRRIIYECDGYVDAEPQLPELILDEDSNIKSGCSFELLLKSHNIDIKDIEVGIMRLVTYDEITNAAKKHFSA